MSNTAIVDKLVAEYLATSKDSQIPPFKVVETAVGAGVAPTVSKSKAWQAFLASYVREHKGEKKFAELVKDAGKAWKAGGGLVPMDTPRANPAPYLHAEASSAVPALKPIRDATKEEAEVELAEQEGGFKAGEAPLGGADGGLSLKEAKDAVVSRAKGAVKAIRGVRDNYPPMSRKVIAKFGGEKITAVYVCRAPLAPILNKAIKAVSKKTPYDKLYHLSIKFKLANGYYLRLDKREVASAVVSRRLKDSDDEVCVEVAGGSFSTPSEVIDATRAKLGVAHYFTYRATGWNCQDFVMSMLDAGGYTITPEIKEFVLQDVAGLVSPIAERIANATTDAVSRLNLIVEGEGMPDNIGGFKAGGAPLDNIASEVKQMSETPQTPQTSKPTFAIAEGEYNPITDPYPADVMEDITDVWRDNAENNIKGGAPLGGCDCGGDSDSDSDSEDEVIEFGGSKESPFDMSDEIDYYRLKLSDKLSRNVSRDEMRGLLADKEMSRYIRGGSRYMNDIESRVVSAYDRSSNNSVNRRIYKINRAVERAERVQMRDAEDEPDLYIKHAREARDALYNERRPRRHHIRMREW